MVKVFPGYGFKNGDCVVLTRNAEGYPLFNVNELPAGSRGTVVRLEYRRYDAPEWGVRFYEPIKALDKWDNIVFFGVENNYLIHPEDLMHAWEHDTRFFPPSVPNPVLKQLKVLHVMMKRQLVGYERVTVEIRVRPDFDHERGNLDEYSAQIEAAIKTTPNDKIDCYSWNESDWEPQSVYYVGDHFA